MQAKRPAISARGGALGRPALKMQGVACTLQRSRAAAAPLDEAAPGGEAGAAARPRPTSGRPTHQCAKLLPRSPAGSSEASGRAASAPAPLPTSHDSLAPGSSSNRSSTVFVLGGS